MSQELHRARTENLGRAGSRYLKGNDRGVPDLRGRDGLTFFAIMRACAVGRNAENDRPFHEVVRFDRYSVYVVVSA